MKNLLVLTTSLNQEKSISNQLVGTFVRKVCSQQDDVNVEARDLASQPLDHLTSAEMQSWMLPALERTAEQQQLAALSDNLIAEVKQADTLVIGMPMYNYGIPSTFKVWMDRIARAGVTFQYTATGPVGLLDKKNVIIIATRGGIHQNTPTDSQTQHLTDFFSLLGIDQVTFIYAEGLNMGQLEASSAAAEQQLEQLIPSLL